MPFDASAPAHQKLLFWLALLLIASVSLLSFLSTQRLLTLSQRVERSQQVLVGVNQLVSFLKDVETGARGYMITNERRYLETFREGPAKFERSVAQLRAAATGEPALARRVERLSALGERRIEIATRAVSSSTPLRVGPEALGFVRAGKATMDLIRAESESLIAAERSQYAARQAAVQRQARLTNLAMAIAIALSLTAIAWLFRLRGREVARRRQAEEDLRTLNRELEDRVRERTAEVERSRELLDAVIENMPDTVFVKDVADQCRYKLVNGAAEKLLGRSRSEMVGSVDHELFPREQADACLEEDRLVAASGQQRVVPERAVTTAGGDVKYVESRKVPLEDANGERRLVLGIVRDITEQKALTDQIRHMQRMDAIGKLTGGVAHDFNNLLAVILGNVEIVREQLDEGSETAEMADEAIGAASRGAELVRRMLAFARMQHLEPQAVDLNERLPAAASLLGRTLGENIAIKVKTLPGLWKAMVDPTQVDDALLNLGINARDAMPAGGTLSIETANIVLDSDYAAHHSEVRPGEYVMLAVSDTGTGMPPEIIARAFEPFFTTKDVGRGTGLGLSQVYGWVKQSGGHIKIYSEMGHGTTLKLYLPRALSEVDSEQEPVSEGAGARGHETILVVEDNAHVRRTVVRQLRDLGYSSVEAANGAEALEMVESGVTFDLLLTDIVMPGNMTGYELAERVRAIRPGQKIIFTSGYTEMAMSNGDRGREGPLLSKPYRKDDLGRAIRALLDS